jgi:Zn-dependent peptidase ImmA (M78 family)/transcriptional regulator with XRE-family HTH domain
MERNVLNSIDPAIIGERLADARRVRGLTQQQAADALGVARTTITAMEKGDRRPRAAELVRLAQLYGRQVRDMVRPVSSSPEPDFVVQFRAARRADGEQPAADSRRFEDLCRWYVEIESLLDAPLPRRYPPEYDITGTPPERAAEEVAASERNRLGLGDGPIGDLWGLLETDVGLRVFALPMSDSRIAGMFVFTEEFGGCIAVNAKQPEERRRWSGAHEFGHFLTNRHQAEVTVFRPRGRLPASERFADAFAKVFLMPVAGLSRRFESIRRAKDKPLTPADVLALSHLYRVSFTAMMFRLEELKLLPLGAWERLRDQGFKPDRARKLMGLSTPGPELPSLPMRYRALMAKAYLDAQLSEGELAERLGVSRVEARLMVERLTSEPEQSDDGEWAQLPIDLSAALVGHS